MLNFSQLLQTETRIRKGQFYVLNAGFYTMSSGAPNFRFTLPNPSASGKNIVVTRLEVDTDAAANYWATLWMNPTTVPGIAAAASNLKAGGAASVVTGAKADNNAAALGGGSVLQYFQIRSGRNDFDAPEHWIYLPPNSTLGLNINMPVASNLTATFFYFEEQ